MSNIRRIETSNAPKAVASYSQGLAIPLSEGLVMVKTSGQVAFDPNTSQLVEGGIREQTQRVLQSLDAILREGNAIPGDLVSVTVLLTNPADFKEFNNVYAQWEWIANQQILPVRYTAVGGLVVPKALVEIQCEAIHKSH
jgi:2-iminobutanoate/2-iminopropanoate deaminase